MQNPELAYVTRRSIHDTRDCTLFWIENILAVDIRYFWLMWLSWSSGR